ncbi:hypothetical protein BDN71DRAFT_1440715 [Pleurotus eryngii]|uniref:Complex 1 LYR protein n=1 Tax=Pleurotus eryngii TaxID=5323 RepID=A0A9P6DB81_PLEER|nr:hypothetical protein BDN71DRAFT_1440715 [Pleurotus eryngii]
MNVRTTYRSVLRELYKSTITPGKVNPELKSSFRSILDKYRTTKDTAVLDRDLENAVTFMRAKREHKRLLDRYNPLHDLTEEERIEATAHRVGFNMPKTHTPS